MVWTWCRAAVEGSRFTVTLPMSSTAVDGVGGGAAGVDGVFTGILAMFA